VIVCTCLFSLECCLQRVVAQPNQPGCLVAKHMVAHKSYPCQSSASAGNKTNHGSLDAHQARRSCSNQCCTQLCSGVLAGNAARAVLPSCREHIAIWLLLPMEAARPVPTPTCHWICQHYCTTHQPAVIAQLLTKTCSSNQCISFTKVIKQAICS